MVKQIFKDGADGLWGVKSEVLGALLVRNGRSISADILGRKFGYTDDQIRELLDVNDFGARAFATRFTDDRLASVHLTETQVAGLQRHLKFTKFMLNFKNHMSARRTRFEWLRTKMGAEADLADVMQDVREKKKKRKMSNPFVRS